MDGIIIDVGQLTDDPSAGPAVAVAAAGYLTPNWELFSVKTLPSGDKAGDIRVTISATRSGCTWVSYRLRWDYVTIPKSDYVASDFATIPEKLVSNPPPSKVTEIIKGLMVGKSIMIGVYVKYRDSRFMDVYDPPFSARGNLVDNVPG
jgi:hypothetical protein